ncbi:hypothetical protein UA08_00974 [Talaromyces atroroseus]|uniref:Potassium transport protein n=1 Tax=Talaromyces atroroseus TaxID=1441469 RepID=A0A225ARZ9_TALAT|nr:hypothetical protein UA08_00974 [Talaromyces atroroseus]OKL64352.1 hypothetical protein UA08_00974 [Talaromyces atroroseus]
MLPPLNFLTLHHVYFIAMALICSVIFWASSKPAHSVNLSTVNSFQQAILFCLILLGHPILISSTVLFVRKRAFESRFRTIVEAHARKRSAAAHAIHLPRIVKRNLGADPNTPVSRDARLEQNHQTLDGINQLAPGGSLANTKTVFETEVRDAEATGWATDDDQVTIHSPIRDRSRHRMFPMAGVGARPDARDPRDAAPGVVVDEDRRPSLIETLNKNSQKYFSSRAFISRNSQFHGLTPNEREKLGGVEYKAICFLSIIVPLYFILFNTLGFIGLGTWITVNRPDVARTNGLDPFWTGSFFAISAFGNNGMSLLDLNMTALQTGHTWYLLATIIVFNAIDWAGFEVLSIGDTAIESLGSYRVLDGLFQALAVRSGGFYVVTISDLHQGLLVLYVLMMYVSAFPVLVTIRNTNVYEERSLGIYANDHLTEDQRRHASLSSFVGHIKAILSSSDKVPYAINNDAQSAAYIDENNTSRSYFVRQQLRSQLSHDIWWICLAVLFIAIAEGPHFKEDPVAYSTFNIIFEVISAYGCVGISVGLPNENYSFCGGWYTISKLILIAVMLRGRHRGLPVAIDKAVMLPDESLAWAEEEDAAMRLEGTRTWNAVHGNTLEGKTGDIV